ncbi:hypothetical protein Droror1_Dr00015980 [Drosera rotundifolia]
MPSIFFSMFGCVLPSKVYIADEQHRESSDAKEMSTKPSKEEKAKDNKWLSWFGCVKGCYCGLLTLAAEVLIVELAEALRL